MRRSKVGEPALDFHLHDVQTGETRSLADYRGKWLVMVFHRHLA